MGYVVQLITRKNFPLLHQAQLILHCILGISSLSPFTSRIDKTSKFRSKRPCSITKETVPHSEVLLKNSPESSCYTVWRFLFYRFTGYNHFWSIISSTTEKFSIEWSYYRISFKDSQKKNRLTFHDSRFSFGIGRGKPSYFKHCPSPKLIIKSKCNVK